MNLLLVKSREELERLRVVDIKDLIRRSGHGFGGFTRKADLIEHYLDLLDNQLKSGPTNIKNQLRNLTVKNIKDMLTRENIKFSHRENKENLIDIYIAKLVPINYLSPDKEESLR